MTLPIALMSWGPGHELHEEGCFAPLRQWDAPRVGAHGRAEAGAGAASCWPWIPAQWAPANRMTWWHW